MLLVLKFKQPPENSISYDWLTKILKIIQFKPVLIELLWGVDLDLKRETTWLVPGWTTMAIFFLSFAPKFVLEYIPKLLIWFKAIIVKAQEGLSISTSRRAIKKGIGNGALDMDWDNGFSPKRSLLKSLSKCNLQGNCFSNGQSSKTSHFEMKQQGYSMGLHGSAFLLIYKHTSTHCLSCPHATVRSMGISNVT